MKAYRRPASTMVIVVLVLALVSFLAVAYLAARPHVAVGEGGSETDLPFRPMMLVIFGGQALLFFGLPLVLMAVRPKTLRVDDDGMEMRSALSTTRLAFRDITQIAKVVRGAAGAGAGMGGALGALASKSDVRKFIFIGASGTRIHVDGVLVDHMGPAFDELYARANAAIAARPAA